MIVITGTYRLPVTALDKARPGMERVIAASRAEEGCIRYSYALDILDEGLIHVSELWADQEALNAHARAPHLAEWRAVLAELGVSDRDIRLYVTDEGVAI